jgi:hypothetical protein
MGHISAIGDVNEWQRTKCPKVHVLARVSTWIGNAGGVVIDAVNLIVGKEKVTQRREIEPLEWGAFQPTII